MTITADRNSPGHQVAADEVRARRLLDGEVHAMREPAISGRVRSPKPNFTPPGLPRRAPVPPGAVGQPLVDLDVGERHLLVHRI
ncbi:hypothetical protein [Streptomyces broussonetiae]|uniref:hypothetical protein n=1 Tax=Streptomyces broussonetiae TaxID=2686304 RepID=UPI0035DB5B0B